MKLKGVTTQMKVLTEYFQSSQEALATDNFLRLLYFTELATYCNHTCIIQMVSSQHNKKCLLCHELLNNLLLLCIKNACNVKFYEQNATALPRCAQARVTPPPPPAINLSPATSFVGQNPAIEMVLLLLMFLSLIGDF